MRGWMMLPALLVAAIPSAAGAVERTADVVVYGGTASGIVAAVTARREGKSVLLVEPSRHLGGMVTGGLGATDTGNRAGIGGYSREFFDRVKSYYTTKYGPKSQQVKDCSEGFRFEPHVAMLVLREMLAEAKIEPLLGQRVERVEKKGARLLSFGTTRGDVFKGRVFLDASYEGDLIALAGVKYHVGREGREVYKESLAGVQAFSRAHQWPVKVSGRDEKGNLLPLIQPGPLGKPGQGDHKVQAYNFRLCITDRKDNQVPFPKPRGYDPGRFELLARYLKAKPDIRVGQLMHPVFMPNRKTDTNNNGPFSTDHIGANWDYPEGDEATRQRIWQDHVEYTQGFLYFLANDPRVPTKLQQEMRTWGLAKDEYQETNHWPPQLYIREARRMVGVYVMTQKDLMEQREKADSVGLGSYNADSHHVQRVVREDGSVLNEGDFQEPVAPYAISYRALLPRETECENLLVPVCLSASHVAYGSIRMEPVFMILGQAAGVAASLAVDEKVSVQKVGVDKLSSLLQKQKAVLSPAGLPGRSAPVKRFEIEKMVGVVVDDREAELTGDWRRSTAMGPFVADGYLHDGDTDKGKMKARYVPKLPTEGRYEVRLYYAPASNRATNTLVVVRSRDGVQEYRVNQKKAWKGEGGLLLGVFAFERGQAGWVEVRNDKTDGHVVVDAVQFVPRK